MDPNGPKRSCSAFHMLPSGGGTAVASNLLSATAASIDWTLHTPEGASLFPMTEAIETRIHSFRGSKRLGGARRLAAPIYLVYRLLSFDRICRTIAGEMSSTGNSSLVFNSMIVAAPPVLRHLETPASYFCFEYPRHIYEKRFILRTGSPFLEKLLAPLEALEKRMDTASVDSADRIITFSSYMQERLRDIYGRDSSLVRPGIDLAPFKGLSTDDSAFGPVLSVGALWPFKGHETVLEAVGRLSGPHRRRMLVIADRELPGYGPALAKRAASVGVELEIEKRVPFERLVRAYRESCAVVCAQHSEPYGLVPLEAMASGTPVIAVDEGGFRDNVAHLDNGLIIQRDPGLIADWLARLLEDGALRKKLVARGLDFVRRERTLESASARLLELL